MNTLAFATYMMAGLPTMVVPPAITPPYRAQHHHLVPWRDMPQCVQIYAGEGVAWAGKRNEACYINPSARPAYVWTGIPKLGLAVVVERWPGAPLLLMPEAWADVGDGR